MAATSATIASELKMYLIVNADLPMGKGKVAGQVGHAVEALVRALEERPSDAYRSWRSGSRAKIVLKASQEQLQALLDNASHTNLLAMPVHDLGRTQIPSGSLTVVGFEPLANEEAPEMIRQLKLL